MSMEIELPAKSLVLPLAVAPTIHHPHIHTGQWGIQLSLHLCFKKAHFAWLITAEEMTHSVKCTATALEAPPLGTWAQECRVDCTVEVTIFKPKRTGYA